MLIDSRTFLRTACAAVLPIAGLWGCASEHAVAADPAPVTSVAPVKEEARSPVIAQAGSGPQGPASFRCDGGLAFSVRFADGAARIDASPGGPEVLQRDAGGATPSQSVFSNGRMRVEFGLGETGREAILREAGASDAVHCVAQ